MATHARTALLAAAILWLLIPATASADSIGDKVVQFCKDNRGKKVGDGECVALAVEALKAAGAKTNADFEDSPKQGDYVWGDLVYAREVKGRKTSEQKVDGKKVQPGDVIQLRDARFEGKLGKGKYLLEASHHTAVVVGLRENGKVLVLLEQNGNGKKIVSEGTYRLDDLKEGWLRVYRPQAK